MPRLPFRSTLIHLSLIGYATDNIFLYHACSPFPQDKLAFQYTHLHSLIMQSSKETMLEIQEKITLLTTSQTPYSAAVEHMQVVISHQYQWMLTIMPIQSEVSTQLNVFSYNFFRDWTVRKSPSPICAHGKVRITIPKQHVVPLCQRFVEKAGLIHSQFFVNHKQSSHLAWVQSLPVYEALREVITWCTTLIVKT